ncbi:BRCA1-associated RING domain protein 1 [Linnemannia schmuckeri]|uniref:BRCA1-associated RING domain protein 1 n=1 Tax=Linnemannia schmuckeri TaxID=64567 RepID=A0A9P5VEG9_9FUNG|nr:BRCA1-associated RING domain protein 1 [Linnemannia schmuckeri]
MHSTTKTHNRNSIPQDENGSDGEQEILPDTTVGILRRMAEEIKCSICLGTMERPMSTGCNHTFCHECILHALSLSDGCPLCKKHVHKRGLNRVDHLEQVIEAFNQLKEAFEQEDGHTLSQAPRHFETEPQENLTQLYPYPEKMNESSSSTSSKPVNSSTMSSITKIPTTNADAKRAPTAEPALSFRQPSARIHDSPSTQSTLPEQSQHIEEINAMSDMDCFDVNLDSVSADQAALLAEKMLAMMLLGPPNELSTSTSHLISSSRRTDHVVSQSCSPTQTVVKQESDVDYDEDELTQPRQDHTQVKAEPPSSIDLFFSGPTQERASGEVNVVICGTYLAPQKKTRMDSVVKSLKGKAINDLTSRPTHIVMDITPEQCQKGGGRTVKFFMGILYGSWVVRFDWILASQEAGYWVDETSYQIADNEMKCNPAKLSRASRARGDPPLFTNYEFQLAGPFVTPTRDEMELMIKTGGGTVVSRLSQRDRTTAANGSGGFTKHVLLYDQTNDGVMSLKKLKADIESTMAHGRSIGKEVSIVPCKTLLDCISQYDMDKMVETIPL